MRHYYLILVIFFNPIPGIGQNAIQHNNDVDSLSEIYAIIKTVITDENLDKKFGLDLIPAKNSNINTEDSVYLVTLLITPKEQDTVLSDFIISKAEWPDKNILSAADISYMLDTKSVLKIFK